MDIKERQRESKERITGRKKAKERKEGKIKEKKERKSMNHCLRVE